MEEQLQPGMTLVKTVEVLSGRAEDSLGSGGQAGEVGLVLAGAELLRDLGWGADPLSELLESR